MKYGSCRVTNQLKRCKNGLAGQMPDTVMTACGLAMGLKLSASALCKLCAETGGWVPCGKGGITIAEET